MKTNVFTYGSLMFAEVWQRVVRGHYQSHAATLNGYRRYAVRDDTYPGIIACPDSAVNGLVYTGVDADDLARLDEFEGELYLRIDAVAIDTQGYPANVQTYLCRDAECLSDQLWSPETFALSRFLETYCRDKLGG